MWISVRSVPLGECKVRAGGLLNHDFQPSLGVFISTDCDPFEWRRPLEHFNIL